jgi:hypothetical protein
MRFDIHVTGISPGVYELKGRVRKSMVMAWGWHSRLAVRSNMMYYMHCKTAFGRGRHKSGMTSSRRWVFSSLYLLARSGLGHRVTWAIYSHESGCYHRKIYILHLYGLVRNRVKVTSPSLMCSRLALKCVSRPIVYLPIL